MALCLIHILEEVKCKNISKYTRKESKASLEKLRVVRNNVPFELSNYIIIEGSRVRGGGEEARRRRKVKSGGDWNGEK